MSEMLGASIAPEVWGVVARTSLLLIVALVSTAAMGRASAAVRHHVWVAALAGAMVLPLVTPLVPWLSVPLPADLVVRAESFGASPSAVFSPFMGGEAEESRAWRGAESWLTGELMSLALLVWVLGALVMARRLLVGARKLRRLARAATPISEGDWLDLARELSRRFGLEREVTLLRGDGGRVAMTWGTVRPVVWLPLEAEGWPEERRRVVLAHEIAHVKRGDAATQWLGHLALVVYWFNPLVWLAARLLHEERERACDDAVLRLGAKPVRYAEHLLQVVRTLGGNPAPPAAIAMARPSRIEGRIRAVLDRSAARDSVSAGASRAIVIVATTCVLMLGALRAEEAKAKEESLPHAVAAEAVNPQRAAEPKNFQADDVSPGAFESSRAPGGGAVERSGKVRAAVAPRGAEISEGEEDPTPAGGISFEDGPLTARFEPNGAPPEVSESATLEDGAGRASTAKAAAGGSAYPQTMEGVLVGLEGASAEASASSSSSGSSSSSASANAMSEDG